jgi:hypothetical protein
MNNERKALLPLIEILISTGIFAIAVILTLQIFMLARFLGNRTSDMADAILKVQYVAETIKAFQSVDEIDKFFENETIQTTGAINTRLSLSGATIYNIYYDINWRQADSADGAVFVTEIYIELQGSVYLYSIDLYKIEPYPFINDRIVQEDPQFRPLLASINAGKFIANIN